MVKGIKFIFPQHRVQMNRFGLLMYRTDAAHINHDYYMDILCVRVRGLVYLSLRRGSPRVIVKPSEPSFLIDIRTATKNPIFLELIAVRGPVL